MRPDRRKDAVFGKQRLPSHNLWAFAGQDPINGWDPFGLSSGGLTNRRPGDYDPSEDAQWWNPVSNLLTALYLLQADQGIRDRMHTRRLRQKFGPQLETVDGEPFRCGVGCTVELAVEVAVHGIDTVTTPVSVVTVAPVAAKLGVRALKAGARKATGKGAQGAAKQGAKPGAAPKAGPSPGARGQARMQGGRVHAWPALQLHRWHPGLDVRWEPQSGR